MSGTGAEDREVGDPQGYSLNPMKPVLCGRLI